MKTQLALFFIFSTYSVFSQNPIADFEVNIHYKCGYATTEFINNSVNADNFLWDIKGDGSFIETFEPRGSNIGIDKKWTVTLIAKKNELSDTLSKEVDVFNTKIKFETSVVGMNIYAPVTVEFFNSSEIREGDNVTYQWNFGDGTKSDENSLNYTYNSIGTHFITLTGTKSDGCELSFTDYIIVRDTAQKGEFEFITSDCIGEGEASPCEYDKHYSLINNTLLIYGSYYGNCGTHKTATLSYEGDTVKVKTWEVGPLTTCDCEFCFEITVPDITQSSVVVMFNGVPISPNPANIIERAIKNPIIKIFPNPANDYLTVIDEGVNLKNAQYEIIDTEGRVVKIGRLNEESQADLRKIERGIYMISILDKDKNKEYVTRFVKE